MAFFCNILDLLATNEYNLLKFIDMQITKNTGRIVGFLFLLATIAGGWGTSIRGLSGARDNIIAFLNSVAENASQMKLAIGLDMLGSGIGVLIAIYLYPIIKKYSARLAIAYVGIGLVNFTIITISNVIHWSLISVGANYADTTASDAPHFATLAIIHYEGYYFAHFLLLMCYAIGGSVLYYSLFKIKLIPLWLAVWGLLASSIVFAGGALQLAEIPVSFYLFIQNGVFILTFIGYLLAMGFRTEKYYALN